MRVDSRLFTILATAALALFLSGNNLNAQGNSEVSGAPKKQANESKIAKVHPSLADLLPDYQGYINEDNSSDYGFKPGQPFLPVRIVLGKFPVANLGGLPDIPYLINGQVVVANEGGDPTVAQDDEVGTDEDTPLIGNVTHDNGNGPDTDPDSDPTSVDTVDGSPANVGIPVTLTSGARLTVNSDGTFSYDPNGQFEALGSGEQTTDSFTYALTDGAGSSNQATVTVTITGLNDAPVANDDIGASFTTDEASSFTTGNVLDNDEDPDGPVPLSLDSFDDTGSIALVTDNDDGTFLYNPNGQLEDLNDGEEATDTFFYTTTDGVATDTARVTITITGVTDGGPPVVADQTFSVAENRPSGTSVGTVAATDPDDDPLTFTMTGTAFAIDAVTGEITVADGSQLDFETTPRFVQEVTVTDSTNLSDTASITINLNDLTENDAPVAVDDAYSVDEDNVLTIPAPGVLDNDTDADGDTLTASLVTGSSNGTLTFNSNGSFSYTPDPDFNSSDSFTYQANDGTLNSNITTVTITITAVNDPLVANDDSGDGFSTDEDTPFTTGNVLDNDVGPDGPDSLSVVGVGGASGGTVTWNFSDAFFTYSPGPQFQSLDDGEQATDSFTYTVSDGIDTATATVTIIIIGVTDPSPNQPPSIDPRTFNVDENSPNGTLVGTAAASDPDTGDTLSFAVTGGTGDTAFAIDPDTGEITVADSSQLGFEVTSGFTLEVEVTDSGGLADSATMTIDLNDDTNDPNLVIGLPNPGEFAVVSPPQLLSEVPTFEQDDTDGVGVVLVYVDGAFVGPSAPRFDADIIKPVSAFYVSASSKARVEFRFAQVTSPGQTTRSLAPEWNFIGTNSAGPAEDELSQIQNTPQAAGMVTLHVPNIQNGNKDFGHEVWGEDGDRDLNANPITQLPGRNLSALDGYWVYMAGPRTYSKQLRIN